MEEWLIALTPDEREVVFEALSDGAASRPKPRHPRQRTFCDLTCDEAFFGGAAGGGKTWALLDWLGEGHAIPDYSGLFLRKTYKQISMGNDNPVTKSFKLYKPLGGKFLKSEMKWVFPSGAAIQFGHLDDSLAHMDYQGIGFHRIGFDELTHFPENQYVEVAFTRKRKTRDFPTEFSTGVRASSNPGGPGHNWVKRRFITPEAERALLGMDPYDPTPEGLIFDCPQPGAVFVPSRVADNLALDIEDYIQTMLAKLPAVLRERMLNGDWSITEDSQIRPDWLRYFKMRGQIIQFTDAKLDVRAELDERQCKRFATVDTAGTGEQKARESKGKPPSWSVVAIWDAGMVNGKVYLALRHIWRKRVVWAELKTEVIEVCREWGVQRLMIEAAHYGPALASEYDGLLPIDLLPVKPKVVDGAEEATGKLARATNFLVKLEKGEVFLPHGNVTWLQPLESEWLTWSGLPDETADQVDVASHAVNQLETLFGSTQTFDLSAWFGRERIRGLV